MTKSDPDLAYSSEAIVVRYRVKRCIHAAQCVQGLPGVFDPNRRPWIRPDRAAADRVAATVLECPTGALRFERRDGGAPERPPAHNEVRVEPNGPLYLHGRLEVNTGAGEPPRQEMRAALCRCGASGNKPYCDGAHRPAGFLDPARLAGPPEEPDASADKALQVRFRPDGPILLEGAFRIRGAAEGPFHLEGRTALCRCGASGNKPYCDGAHRKSGFSAP